MEGGGGHSSPACQRRAEGSSVKLRIGYELDYDFPQPTPLILMLNVHFSRFSDLETPDYMRIRPSVPVRAYRDGFGNWCTRLVAPQGRMRITADAVISDSGLPEAHDRSAGQVPVEDLPEEAIVFLLASRFCDSDRLLDLAWELFGTTPPGGAARPGDLRLRQPAHRLQLQRRERDALGFGRLCGRAGRLPRLRPSRHRVLPGDEHPGALLHLLSRRCRHAAALAAGDFAASFEAYLEGGWQMFDPRNNVPRIGRVLIARRPRCGRCRHRHHLRAEHADRLQSLDRRGGRGVSQWRRARSGRAVSVCRALSPGTARRCPASWRAAASCGPGPWPWGPRGRSPHLPAIAARLRPARSVRGRQWPAWPQRPFVRPGLLGRVDGPEADHFFFGPAARATAAAKVEGAAAVTFGLSCFGFLASRFPRCSPFAMVGLPWV